MNPIPLAVLLVLLAAQQPDSQPSELIQQQAREKSESFRLAALHINQLASNIHSEEDARTLVDAIAEQFGGGQFQSWITQPVRHRIARAEFQAISDSARLIPEKRIVDTWNEYVRAIDAPVETLVSVAELHNLRDAIYASSRMLWDRKGMQQLWTIPSIYAVEPGGKIANGCRALEALKILHDMSFSFQNIESARERLQKGILASDRSNEREQKLDSAPVNAQVSIGASARIDPVRAAESRYAQMHSETEHRLLLERLFAELFPAD
jgi:hypothetical protein